MKYIYFLSLTLTRFDKKWYIVVGAVLLFSFVAGIVAIKRKQATPVQAAMRVLFVGYIVLALLGTIVSRTPQEPFQLRLNMIAACKDFLNGNFSVQIEMLSNIILFIPFGFLLPFNIDKKFSLRKQVGITLAAAVIFTLSIELVQFASGHGLFESADVLCNLIGAVIGLALSVAAIKTIRLIKSKRSLKELDDSVKGNAEKK